jgi:2-dehydro-3-deoxygluconokinase
MDSDFVSQSETKSVDSQVREVNFEMGLDLRKKEISRWDLVSLGEVMLRLDPGDFRVATAREFRVFEGGGEYNVARGLKRCFGLKTAVVTALADNPIGRLVEDLMYQGGVDQSHVRWAKYDGVGRTVRNGLNFTERGFGVRAAVGCSDRGNTAISQLSAGQIDWQKIFGEEGSRWFHTGGIFAALSPTTPAVAAEAMDAARQQGAWISYDLNYRESLWKANGGKQEATRVNRELVRKVDVLIGNEEDFTAALGFEVENVDEHLSELDISSYQRMIERVIAEFPNVKIVGTTLRNAKTACVNDWSAIAWHDGKLYRSLERPDLEIYDRIGGGDSFCSGLIYGLLTGRDVQWAVECGAAHGALAMTTPGDVSMATLADVERVMKGGGARVAR